MKRFFHTASAVALSLFCTIGTAITAQAAGNIPFSSCPATIQCLNGCDVAALQEQLQQLCNNGQCATGCDTAALQEHLQQFCNNGQCAVGCDTTALQEQLQQLCANGQCSAAEWLNHLADMSRTTPSQPATEPTQPATEPTQPATEPTQPASTPTQPTETPTATPTNTSSAYEQQVIDLINEIRTQNGLSPLTENAALSRCARAKSQDMHDKGYFSHQSPTYGSPFDMMKQFGITYRTAGENIAMGQSTPQAVVNAWMNSEGHRANILNASFTQIGMGYVADGHYWTQQFIG